VLVIPRLGVSVGSRAKLVYSSFDFPPFSGGLQFLPPRAPVFTRGGPAYNPSSHLLRPIQLSLIFQGLPLRNELLPLYGIETLQDRCGIEKNVLQRLKTALPILGQ